jgi:hypothetical protein
MSKTKNSILLTLDAFGTLFTPREPVAKLYGDVARRLGLTGIKDEHLTSAFRAGEFRIFLYWRMIGLKKA